MRPNVAALTTSQVVAATKFYLLRRPGRV